MIAFILRLGQGAVVHDMLAPAVRGFVSTFVLESGRRQIKLAIRLSTCATIELREIVRDSTIVLSYRIEVSVPANPSDSIELTIVSMLIIFPPFVISTSLCENALNERKYENGEYIHFHSLINYTIIEKFD